MIYYKIYVHRPHWSETSMSYWPNELTLFPILLMYGWGGILNFSVMLKDRGFSFSIFPNAFNLHTILVPKRKLCLLWKIVQNIHCPWRPVVELVQCHSGNRRTCRLLMYLNSSKKVRKCLLVGYFCENMPHSVNQKSYYWKVFPFQRHVIHWNRLLMSEDTALWMWLGH